MGGRVIIARFGWRQVAEDGGGHPRQKRRSRRASGVLAVPDVPSVRRPSSSFFFANFTKVMVAVLARPMLSLSALEALTALACSPLSHSMQSSSLHISSLMVSSSADGLRG